jgi:leucyl-tRNA synthetase
VLANEQVINGGYCWRHEDTLVEKKWLKQWFLKITDYADELLDSLPDLEWPEKIKTMQANWIGRSEGAEISFAVDGHDEEVQVFTTRPDTIYGVTFMVVAPEHLLVDKITTPEQKAAVDTYVKEAEKKSDIDRMSESREKTGIFTGAYAVNPVNKEKIPIWIADYVLMGYGTGAIMAVPAHDDRDNEFAKKFDLPIKQVILEEFIDKLIPPRADVETKFRRAVQCIIKHPTEDTYLLLKKLKWQTESYSLVNGGIDGEETVEDAAKREMLEESGLTNIVSMKSVGEPYIAEFYHEMKKENVRAEMHTVEVTIKDLTAVDISEEEAGINEQMWVSSKELIEKVHGEGIQRILEEYFGGERTLGHEGIMVNSGPYDGTPSFEAREKVVAELEGLKAGEAKTTYRMRDWLVSRQRYWGAPIPIIHCEKDGAVAVPEDQLPVILPPVENYEPRGDGKSVLAHVPEWYNVECPKCGGPAVRETDTLDGYVCSSWYLFRYADASNDQAPWDPAKANYWAPLDYYCGGDHAVAHLLYVRFWTKFLRDQGMLNFGEPIKELIYNGYINAADGTKMSKSKGNVVDPLDLIDQGYGADALRVYELFIGPYEQDAAWDPKGIAGSYRFLSRVWVLAQEYLASDHAEGAAQQDVLVATHKAIKRVSLDLGRQSFNTAVAALMELVNDLYKFKTNGFTDKGAWQFALTSLLQLLQPLAPHTAQELWQQMGNEDMVHDRMWPEWDENYLVTDMITVVVQVNGRLRAQLQLPKDVSQEDAVSAAKADEKVKAHLGAGEPKKTIYVPGKLVNFVV